MTALIEFMASMAGRIVRALVGLALLILAFQTAGAAMWILYLLGIFFVGVGIFDVCVLAPLAGLPFTGKGIRARHT